MAVAQTYIAATPKKVFAVLSDPDSYGYWVVGSERIRDADPDWPAPGTRFHHSVGFGPFTVDDHTECRELEEPRKIVLRAKLRPLGTTTVTLDLEPEGRGTRVQMTEEAGDFLTALVFNPLTHLLVRGRNEKSLRRLAELAERKRR